MVGAAARNEGIRRDARGIHSLSRLEDGVRVRVLATEQHVGATTEPTLRDLSDALIAAYGTDYGVPQSHLDLPVRRT